MKRRPGQAALIAAATILLSSPGMLAQTPTPIRRALPVQEPPVARAIPVETTPAPVPAPTIMRALPVPAVTEPIPSPTAAPSSIESGPTENAESPAQNQLDYANGLFGRKLYDLAVPEYEKFLGLYPNSPDRVTALFYMGQSYRALNRSNAARSSFQTVTARLSRERVGRARPPTASRRFILTTRTTPAPCPFSIAPRPK